MALVDYTGRECWGCGQLSDDIAVNDDWTDEDFDMCSVETNCGSWYCHRDCYRDSRG